MATSAPIENATEQPKADGKLLAKNQANFHAYMKARFATLQQVAASHMNPQRLLKVAMLSVSRTPLLQQCTVDSIFRATLQAAECGLMPGSATGECYLVPFRNKSGAYEAQFMPGYRGLIVLAFRSGHVKSVRAKVVYKGDKFTYKEGLNFVLDHEPDLAGSRNPSDIEFAYSVVQLKDGGVLPDVMTRAEIENIRKRSKAANNGPWVTDYAEMCRKTVCKRNLKYAPMSAEMSKALAADEAVETGDVTSLGEFDFIDAEGVELPIEEEASKSQSLLDKMEEVKE